MTAPAGAGLNVQVRLGARLGAGRRTVHLDDGATVGDLLARLAPEIGLDEERLGGVAVALRGDVVARDRRLADGDQIALVLPVAGG